MWFSKKQKSVPPKTYIVELIIETTKGNYFNKEITQNYPIYLEMLKKCNSIIQNNRTTLSKNETYSLLDLGINEQDTMLIKTDSFISQYINHG